VFVALTAVMMFFGGFIVFWAFLGGLGQANGFSDATIGKWVSVGILTYGVGGLLTALLGDRVGRVLPIGIASIATVMPLIFLAVKTGLWQFALAAAVVPTASAFGLAYQMGLVATADVSGRFASLIAAAVALAAMASTGIGGALIEAYGFSGLYVFVAGLTFSALGLCIWLSIQMREAEFATDTG
jgi:predicted MFS family arabinose efflux permease